MNKKVVWTIVLVILVVAIILISTSGDKESQQIPDDQIQGTNLPNVGEEQYNTLATSEDDFSALDEAVNQLE